MKSLRDLSKIAVVKHGAGPRWDIPEILREELLDMEIVTIQEKMKGNFTSNGGNGNGFQHIDVYPSFGVRGLEWNFATETPGGAWALVTLMPDGETEVPPEMARLFLLSPQSNNLVVEGYILDPERHSVKVKGYYFASSGRKFFVTTFTFLEANGVKQFVIETFKFGNSTVDKVRIEMSNEFQV